MAGTIGYTYNNDFRVTTETLNGANVASFTYNADGLLATAGSLSLTRNSQNGLLTGTVLGGVTDSLSYNNLANLMSYSAAYAGSEIYSASYIQDALGRVTQKTETIGGVITTFGYTYDAADRLSSVAQNGSPVTTYTYDSNGNRTGSTGPGGAVIANYDTQDRLTAYGSATYSYTANGELLSKNDNGQTTSYQYDALGNLTATTLPSGQVIEYLIDGNNRRIGKKVNGTLVQALLYQGQLRPVAELDDSNNIVSRFVYATRINVPDYMIKASVTYRVITDHLGSPRLVVNTATGAIVQRMDYDELGNVMNDTNPGFQPFGFSGGLYDRDTKLTRFGARDYDAQTGRWTAKDPIQFNGGDSNLYAYAKNDPVNFIDPVGMTREDIDRLTELARETQPDLDVPPAGSVGTAPFVGDGSAITNPLTLGVTVDNFYLRELTDQQGQLLLETIIHESIHRTNPRSEMFSNPFTHPDIYDEAERRRRGVDEKLCY